MFFFEQAVQTLKALRQRGLGLGSLQLRLTLGITTVSLLGVGGIGTWTSWEMRQMLVVQHQDYLKSIGDRIPAELSAKDSVKPIELQELINPWAAPNLWLWVKATDGTIMAASQNLTSFPGDAAQMPAAMMPAEPKISPVNGRYLVLSSQPLSLQGKSLGQVYLAQDITHDYTVLSTLLNSLRFATAVAIAVIATLIAYWVWRSLHPLRQMNRLAIAQGDLPDSLEQVPSEVKGLVQAFDTLSNRLSEADEHQRQFTNSISHEIRTSLSMVYGYLQSTLRRSANLTSAQKEALEVAVEETERTIQLLKDLIDLARINSDTLAFRIGPVILNDLVETAINQLAVRAAASDASSALDALEVAKPAAEIEADRDPIVAQADSEQLVRVLIHLIDNANRYAKTDQPTLIKLRETQTAALIQVCDRGCGISLKDQAHIFEPFYRVDPSRCRTTGGIGLGLAIVKSLVEGMKGQITVESSPGAGSIFTVTLPLCRKSSYRTLRSA